MTSFGSGNIILGGQGSDIMEGRGGDDLIDGDKWLNVRIGVFENLDGTGDEIASFDSMTDMVALMVNGTYNPGQLKIVREILPGDVNAVDNFDTVYFSGPLEDYTISIDANGTIGDLRTISSPLRTMSATMAPTASPISSGCSSEIRRSSCGRVSMRSRRAC
mgnify:CR=1 FL=1